LPLLRGCRIPLLEGVQAGGAAAGSTSDGTAVRKHGGLASCGLVGDGPAPTHRPQLQKEGRRVEVEVRSRRGGRVRGHVCCAGSGE
jgi:hypothetical protein